MNSSARQMRRISTAALGGLLAAALFTASSIPAFAQSRTWISPSGGSWHSPTLWADGIVAEGIDCRADFSTLDLTANATVTIDRDWTIGHLLFGDTTPTHDWFLKRIPYELTLATTSGNPTITVLNRTASISITLAGAQDVTKCGAGLLYLGGNPSEFTGNLIIAEGTVQLSGYFYKDVPCSAGKGTTIVLGSPHTNGTLKFDGGGQDNNRDWVLFDNGSGTIDLAADASLDLNGTISGAGDLIKSGGTTGGYSTGTRLSLNGINTYTGNTYINEGVLQVNGKGTIPDTSHVTVAPGARLRLNKAEAINGLSGSGVVQTYNGSAQTLTVGAAGGDGSFGGVIEPGISLVKTGAGVQILTGVNTFTGNVTVAEGVLEVATIENKDVACNLGKGTTVTLGSPGHNGTLRYGAAVQNNNRDWILADGGSGTFEVSGYMDLNGTISGGGDLIKTGGTTGSYTTGTRLSLNGVNTYAGDTRIDEGVLQVHGNGTIPDTSQVTIAAGARLRLNKAETINGLSGGGVVQTYNGSAWTFTVGAAGGNGSFDGVLEPGISLVKTGAGTQVLSGQNTYTGTTTVNDGALLIDGRITSDTTVRGGVLGGNGTIGGSVTIERQGGISAGHSAGHLVIEGPLVHRGTMQVDLYGAEQGTTSGYDWIEVTGGQPATLDGQVTLVLGEGFLPAAGTFRVLTAAEILLGDNFQLNVVATRSASDEVWGWAIISLDGGLESLELFVDSAPEPEALVLFGLGFWGVVWGRRKRKKKGRHRRDAKDAEERRIIAD